MRFRELRKGELEGLREKSKMAYDKLEFPEVLEESIVLEDDEGIPRMILMAEKVAEVFMVIDHEWQTPAMRWEMIRVGNQELRRRLGGKGFRTAYAIFPESVPEGWVKRLVRSCGAVLQSKCVRFTDGRP